MSSDVHVKVAVRCRPMSSREVQRGSSSIISIEGNAISIRNPESTKDPVKQFTFDHSYDIDSKQHAVYNDIGKPIIEQAFLGYNGTIFAYGQTGSGKTHTMMGSGDDVGIIPLMNEDLFIRVQEQVTEEKKFLITVSFLEIYNEVIKDLLNPSDKFLKIREHPDMGIYVEQLAELVVRDSSEISRLIDQGNKVRQVAATQMNERSSRSHSCFTIKIESKCSEQLGEVTREVTTKSKINLVDLAGSERAAKTGATGNRLKEGAAINKSLSALGNVINMLADKSKGAHVPYRDSKLTRLLQESLGGNSLTVMVAAVSPADYNYDESLGTLQYANRAKSIKNATKKNEDVNEKIIRELREEIDRLRKMVQSDAVQDRPGTANETDHVEMSKMEEMIANLERAKQQSWEEKERLAKLYEQERQKSLSNESNVVEFMQTVKEEKVEAIKRVKRLQQEKAKVTKLFREKKEVYTGTKNKLQSDMKLYQSLQKQKAETPEKIEQCEKQMLDLLQGIEKAKEAITTERSTLTMLKERQEKIEEKLIEEKADMAATTAILEEDEKLRRGIQDDERAKMEQEKELYLKTALEGERQRLQEEAEAERRKLQADSVTHTVKEKCLQHELESSQKLAIDLEQQMQLMLMEKKNLHSQVQLHCQELVTGVKEEQQNMQAKYDFLVQMLKQAHQDILYLTKQNQLLQKQLHQAQMYEPY